MASPSTWPPSIRTRSGSRFRPPEPGTAGLLDATAHCTERASVMENDAGPSRATGAESAAVAIAGMALLWGSIGVVVRQVDLSAVAIVWARVVLAAPALAVFVAWRMPGRW